MKDDNSRLRELFRLYQANALDEEGYAEWWSLLQAHAGDPGLSAALEELWEEAGAAGPAMAPDAWEEKMRRLLAEEHGAGSRPLPRRPWWRGRLPRAAAAAVLGALAVAAYYLAEQAPSPAGSPEVPAAFAHLPPGGARAELVLSNGSVVALDSAAEGVVGQQGGMRILKAGSGGIAYRGQERDPEAVVYNTLRTPRGGKYRLILPDSTVVWLNAASSIRFPTAFPGPQRSVQVTGEAYFEVSADPQRPFVVTADDLTVTVLGTRFDIMAYEDEPEVCAQLLEGRVRVNKGHTSATLKAGQSARWDRNGVIAVGSHVREDEALAWVHELFWFNDDDIYAVMRKVSRWYNVDIEVRGDIPNHFTGSIPRDVELSRVFDILQATRHMQYTMEDNHIIVTP